MRTVTDQFAEILAAAGAKRIYGIVGDSLNGLTDAIRRQGRIEWVHLRHEEVAAFAAGAEAHLTGELAVCAGSCGPFAEASLAGFGTAQLGQFEACLDGGAVNHVRSVHFSKDRSRRISDSFVAFLRPPHFFFRISYSGSGPYCLSAAGMRSLLPASCIARFPAAEARWLHGCPAHVSIVGELSMHREAGVEGERLVARFDEFEVVAELLTVGRIGAVLDYRFGALARILPAQIGDAVLSDQYLNGMLAVIHMADHWNDCRDLPSF